VKASLWLWIWQRITAVLLLLLVWIHFGIMHFVDPTVEITFAASTLRLQSVLYALVDSLLLITGLFHGLNGLRNVILDYWPHAGRAASWVLGIIGVVAAAYGSTALFAFLTAK